MKITIHTDTSDKIRELSDITQNNHLAYCQKHDYTYDCVYFDYENYNKHIIDKLKGVYKLLENSDILMVVGADTMFMNWRIKVEDLVERTDHVLVAKENANWWAINNEVMIYKNTPKSLKLFQRWIDDFEVWRYYPWTLQAHLWNLLQEDEEVRNTVRIVESKVMNQHPKDWKIGDYLVHFYGMPIADKVKLAKQFQEHWGDGTATWKIKHNAERPGVI